MKAEMWISNLHVWIFQPLGCSDLAMQQNLDLADNNEALQRYDVLYSDFDIKWKNNEIIDFYDFLWILSEFRQLVGHRIILLYRVL